MQEAAGRRCDPSHAAPACLLSSHSSVLRLTSLRARSRRQQLQREVASPRLLKNRLQRCRSCRPPDNDAIRSADSATLAAICGSAVEAEPPPTTRTPHRGRVRARSAKYKIVTTASDDDPLRGRPRQRHRLQEDGSGRVPAVPPAPKANSNAGFHHCVSHIRNADATSGAS